MFFIFGSPRSGTTLLAQNLTAHGRIEVPYETDFIVPVAFVFDRIKDAAAGRPLIQNLIINSTGFKRSLGQYLTPSQIGEIVQATDYDLGSLLTVLYAQIAEKAGKEFAGDKSPNDLQFVRIVMKHLKERVDIKVLHIVRDLRDVMVSIKARGWSKDADTYFPRMWSSSNLYLHEALRADQRRYLLLRYEDMVVAPEQTFSDVCAFLNVDFEVSMLDHARRARRFKHMSHHQRLFNPINAERIGAYRSELDSTAIATYESQASEALQAFGYTTSGNVTG